MPMQLRVGLRLFHANYAVRPDYPRSETEKQRERDSPVSQLRIATNIFAKHWTRMVGTVDPFAQYSQQLEKTSIVTISSAMRLLLPGFLPHYPYGWCEAAAEASPRGARKILCPSDQEPVELSDVANDCSVFPQTEWGPLSCCLRGASSTIRTDSNVLRPHLRVGRRSPEAGRRYRLGFGVTALRSPA